MPERGVLAVPAACRPAGSSRPAPLRCILHGTARQASGGRRDGTGRDEEGEAERGAAEGVGPGWSGGPGGGAESRECRGGATHDGGQDVSHDVTGAGGQGIKSRLAGPSSRLLPVGPWLPSNHTNGAPRISPKTETVLVLAMARRQERARTASRTGIMRCDL